MKENVALSLSIALKIKYTDSIQRLIRNRSQSQTETEREFVFAFFFSPSNQSLLIDAFRLKERFIYLFIY
jgi:hypothetical protein